MDWKKKRRLVSPLLFFMPFSLEFPNVLFKLPCAYHFFFFLLACSFNDFADFCSKKDILFTCVSRR